MTDLLTKILTRADHDPGPEWPDIRREMDIADGAPERHQSRVRATLEAAFVGAGAVAAGAQFLAKVLFGEEGVNFVVLREHEMRVLDDPSLIRRAYMLILCDLGGIGGPRGYRGGSTQRMQWAQSLGKGRWHARDGAAYSAASQHAARLVADNEAWAEDRELRRQQKRDTLVQLVDCVPPEDCAFLHAQCLRQLEAPSTYTPEEAHAWERTLYRVVYMEVLGDFAGAPVPLRVDTVISDVMRRGAGLPDRYLDYSRLYGMVENWIDGTEGVSDASGYARGPEPPNAAEAAERIVKAARGES